MILHRLRIGLLVVMFALLAVAFALPVVTYWRQGDTFPGMQAGALYMLLAFVVGWIVEKVDKKIWKQERHQPRGPAT